MLGDPMSHKRKILAGSASNLVRVLLSMLVSLVLPPFLVHHMVAAEYSAWVLIFQLSAYVSLLDFGMQTAIGKFVAEHDARDERAASHKIVSTSFTILAGAGAIACIAIAIMVWSVPRLFHQMPAGLIPQVRVGLLAVGLSTAIALPFTTFTSIFTGLQQYVFPTVTATVSRVGSAVLLILLLLAHGSLVELALVMAAFNVATAASQFLGWRRFVRVRVDFSFLVFHGESAIKLAKYGSVLTIFGLAMFFISGLDTVIVGHYQYKETGAYAIGAAAANFMGALVSSIFGPLIPAVSSMQAGSTPTRIGELCTRTTRDCTLLLSLFGLPLVFGAYPLLSLWVGKKYALQSALYLEILVLGNVVRQLGFPYILCVVATGKQHMAIFAAISEATVNVLISIWLVQKIGATGVAFGTLVGAFVSLTVHFLVSIPRTQSAILIDRPRFLLQGLLRPFAVIVPSILLYPFWIRLNMLPAKPAVIVLWVAMTAAIAWWVALTAEDRHEAGAALHKLYLKVPQF